MVPVRSLGIAGKRHRESAHNHVASAVLEDPAVLGGDGKRGLQRGVAHPAELAELGGRHGGAMLDGQQELLAVAAQLEVRVAPGVELARPAKRPTGAHLGPSMSCSRSVFPLHRSARSVRGCT